MNAEQVVLALFDGEIDPRRELMRLPSRIDQVKTKCRERFDGWARSEAVYNDNYTEIAEQIVTHVVDEYGLAFQDEDDKIRTWNNVYADLMAHVDRKYPTATS